MKAALSELDRAFPKLPGDLSPSFRDAAWKQREQELRDLSTWAVAGGDALPVPPTAEQIKPAIERFGAWCGKLQALAKDFPLNREILTPADRPDLAWEKKEPQFWQDPTVQALVAPDVQRIRALAAVNQANRTELAQLAGGGPTEVALAAWRRLGGAGSEGAAAISPLWPTRAGELRSRRRSRGRLTELLKGVRDTAARDAATAELKAQGPQRWRRFANAATPELLAEAVDNRAAMGVNLSEVAKLDPPARFNLALYTAKAAAGDATPTVIRTVTDELRGSRGSKDRTSHCRPPDEARPDQRTRADGTGPGGKSPPAYQLPIAKSQYHLDFVRVAPKGMRPFYLSTTEVSFGAFVDAVNSAGNWTDANALLDNSLLPCGPARRRKARSSGRPASSGQPITRFVNWRYDSLTRSTSSRPCVRTRAGSTRNQDPPRIRRRPERKPIPMQQVPAQAAFFAAALMNCRLPTTAEWAGGEQRHKSASPQRSEAKPP